MIGAGEEPCGRRCRDLQQRRGDRAVASQACRRHLAVTVVDNGSSDDTLAVVRSVPLKARVLQTPRNMGYGTAFRSGLLWRQGDVPDLDQPRRRTRGRCDCGAGRRWQAVTDAGLLAPCSRDPNGRIEFRQRTAHARFLTNPRNIPIEPEGDCCAPYVGGAVMMFRRSALVMIGGFDERHLIGTAETRLVDALAQTVVASVFGKEARRAAPGRSRRGCRFCRHRRSPAPHRVLGNSRKASDMVQKPTPAWRS